MKLCLGSLKFVCTKLQLISSCHSVYADVNSPGFTDRIASYHQEANSETPSSGYTTPGQFPSVKLAKDNVRLVTMKNRPKPYIPVTVRIAPPVTE